MENNSLLQVVCRQLTCIAQNATLPREQKSGSNRIEGETLLLVLFGDTLYDPSAQINVYDLLASEHDNFLFANNANQNPRLVKIDNFTVVCTERAASHYSGENRDIHHYQIRLDGIAFFADEKSENQWAITHWNSPVNGIKPGPAVFECPQTLQARNLLEWSSMCSTPKVASASNVPDPYARLERILELMEGKTGRDPVTDIQSIQQLQSRVSTKLSHHTTPNNSHPSSVARSKTDASKPQTPKASSVHRSSSKLIAHSTITSNQELELQEHNDFNGLHSLTNAGEDKLMLHGMEDLHNLISQSSGATRAGVKQPSTNSKVASSQIEGSKGDSGAPKKRGRKSAGSKDHANANPNPKPADPQRPLPKQSVSKSRKKKVNNLVVDLEDEDDPTQGSGDKRGESDDDVIMEELPQIFRRPKTMIENIEDVDAEEDTRPPGSAENFSQNQNPGLSQMVDELGSLPISEKHFLEDSSENELSLQIQKVIPPQIAFKSIEQTYFERIRPKRLPPLVPIVENRNRKSLTGLINLEAEEPSKKTERSRVSQKGQSKSSKRPKDSADGWKATSPETNPSAQSVSKMLDETQNQASNRVPSPQRRAEDQIQQLQREKQVETGFTSPQQDKASLDVGALSLLLQKIHQESGRSRGEDRDLESSCDKQLPLPQIVDLQSITRREQDGLEVPELGETMLGKRMASVIQEVKVPESEVPANLNSIQELLKVMAEKDEIISMQEDCIEDLRSKRELLDKKLEDLESRVKSGVSLCASDRETNRVLESYKVYQKNGVLKYYRPSLDMEALEKQLAEVEAYSSWLGVMLVRSKVKSILVQPHEEKKARSRRVSFSESEPEVFYREFPNSEYWEEGSGQESGGSGKCSEKMRTENEQLLVQMNMTDESTSSNKSETPEPQPKKKRGRSGKTARHKRTEHNTHNVLWSEETSPIT